jgi:serine/threonine protein kinase KIN1/2
VNGNGNSYSGSRWGESFSNSSLAMSFDSSNSKNDANAPKKSKRFSGFDYYRRKLSSPASSPPSTPPSHSPPNSQHQLAYPSFSDPNREPLDPTKGFHPMYYLSREKLERDRVYGPGRFASSQLSIQGDAAKVAAANLVTPVDEAPLRQQQFNLTLQSPRALPLPPKQYCRLPRKRIIVWHCLCFQLRKRYISLGCRMITVLLLLLRSTILNLVHGTLGCYPLHLRPPRLNSI